MLDNYKRRHQIKVHKTAAKKTFQYSLRLDKKHYNMLHSMAVRSTMADVIDRAIEVEFDYQQLIVNLFQKMPKFSNKNDVDQWVVSISKSKPELLNKLAKASAIYDYSLNQKKLLKVQQNYLNDLDTIGYFLNKIGVNINQLAKRSNNGFSVNSNELSNIVNEMERISHSVDLIRLELS